MAVNAGQAAQKVLSWARARSIVVTAGQAAQKVVAARMAFTTVQHGFVGSQAH